MTVAVVAPHQLLEVKGLRMHCHVTEGIITSRKIGEIKRSTASTLRSVAMRPWVWSARAAAARRRRASAVVAARRTVVKRAVSIVKDALSELDKKKLSDALDPYPNSAAAKNRCHCRRALAAQRSERRTPQLISLLH